MAVNDTPIKPGQVWRTYLGTEVTIDRRTPEGTFLAIDKEGNTRIYNERGQVEPSAYLAVDLEVLVKESEQFDFDAPRKDYPKIDPEMVVTEDTSTPADQQLFASIDEVIQHIADHGTQPGKVFFVANPSDTPLPVSFADAVDDTVDPDSLASETLQALGWTFDGQCWVQPSAMPTSDDITAHPLYPIYMAAIEQAMYGKGERHGGARTPFLDQPWVHYVKMHGRGFATGQAAKKLEEAASTREGTAFETEVLGAIVYSGMAILKERGVV